MNNKEYLDIRQFESDLKPIIDYDIYKNIFIRDDLTLEEIKKTLGVLYNIFDPSKTNHYPELKKLAAEKTYDNICSNIPVYGKRLSINIYSFANAAYMEIKDEQTYLTVSGYTVVYEQINCGYEWSIDPSYKKVHTYFVLYNNKIIGVLNEDMSERNTFRSYEGKILTLPIIKDKKIKNEAAYNLYSGCLGLYKPIGSFSFNYDEFDMSINNHDLKYVFIIIESSLRAYTVDNNNRQIVFISANDHILVSESVNRIFTNFHICGFEDIYKIIYKIPSQLKEAVSLQRVIMSLNN